MNAGVSFSCFPCGKRKYQALAYKKYIIQIQLLRRPDEHIEKGEFEVRVGQMLDQRSLTPMPLARRRRKEIVSDNEIQRRSAKQIH
jgi:hypothetical protein